MYWEGYKFDISQLNLDVRYNYTLNNSYEKAFLCSLAGKDASLSDLPRYWQVENVIDINKLIQDLISSEYLIIAENLDTELNSLSTASLKQLLKQHNLKMSGKKTELIERLIANVDNDELIICIGGLRKYFIPTEKSIAIINDYKSNKFSRFTQLHKQMYKHIVNNDLEMAYKTRYEFTAKSEMQLLQKSKEALTRGMNNRTCFVCSCLNFIFRQSKDDRLAVYIIIEMLGYSSKQSLQIFKDITGSSCAAFDDVCFLIKVLYGIWELASLIHHRIESYQILIVYDNKVCEKCIEMDNKIYRTVDAVIGENFPPFCFNCRCRVLSCSIPGQTASDLRSLKWARNPKTGKGYEIPVNLRYIDWIKEFKTPTEVLDTNLFESKQNSKVQITDLLVDKGFALFIKTTLNELYAL